MSTSGTSGVILLVDDNAAILESTARYLRSRDLEVICSSSPFGVPSLMSKHSPSVIVLDVMIPALSGEAIGAMLRQQQQAAPIIYYSAMQEEQLYKLSQKTPDTSYVLKSDGNEILYQAICRAMEGKR
jgi:DNA-binding NarL/FixJ family response regulator